MVAFGSNAIYIGLVNKQNNCKQWQPQSIYFLQQISSKLIRWVDVSAEKIVYFSFDKDLL